jgi:hypothetical protein
MNFEFDQSEHHLCAVDDKTHAAVKRFFGGGAAGHEVSDKLLYKRSNEDVSEDAYRSPA